MGSLTMIRDNEVLNAELGRLKQKIGIASEVDVCWLPGTVKYKNGRQLLEEVAGDKILIYVENIGDAKHLLAHGLLEWVLNQHSKKYRLLINKLIEVFEEIQYEKKEKTVEALSELLRK